MTDWGKSHTKKISRLLKGGLNYNRSSFWFLESSAAYPVGVLEGHFEVCWVDSWGVSDFWFTVCICGFVCGLILGLSQTLK